MFITIATNIHQLQQFFVLFNFDIYGLGGDVLETILIGNKIDSFMDQQLQ
jgi:hypothetical protein